MSTRRFKVYVQKDLSGNDWKEYHRLIPINARRQERGLGSSSLRMLPKDSEKWVKVPATFDQNIGDELQDLENGLWVGIIDTDISDGPPGGDEATIFLGYINDIVRTTYEAKSDSIGTVTVNELGHYFAQIPIWSDKFTDEQAKTLNSPPDFNALINGQYYANREADNNRFKVFDILKTDVNNTAWTQVDQNKPIPEINIWSRNDILELLADTTFLNYEPVRSGNKAIPFLNDKSKPQSFPSYIGRTITDMLDDLIPEPLSYYFDYTSSTGGADLKIFSKSNNEIAGIPSAGTLETAYDPVLQETGTFDDLNITNTSNPIDTVTIKGNPVVVTASMTPWLAGNGNALEKGWTQIEEDRYLEGKPQGGFDPSEQQADQYRKSIQNVYQFFKFRKGYNHNILRSKKAGVVKNGGATFPFCPEFKFVDDDGNNISKPLIKDTVSSNPNPTSLKFANFLPFRDANSNLIGPQIWAYSRIDGKEPYWYNLLDSVGQMQSKLEYTTDGLIIKSPVPHLLAWGDPEGSDEGGIWSDEDGDIVDMPDGEWSSSVAGVTQYNPDTTDVVGKTNWGRLIFTISIESDDILEVTKQKDLTGTGSQPDIYKRRIIDMDLDCWWVAPGTSLLADEWRTINNFGEQWEIETSLGEQTSVIRVNGSAGDAGGFFAKNDLPLANEILDLAFLWLTEPKQSASIEYQLDNVNNSNFPWDVGNMIKKITDRSGEVGANPGNDNNGSAEWTCNTTVSSVEYIFNEDSPRLIITTEIPAEPAFKDLLTGNKNRNSVTPVSSRTPNSGGGTGDKNNKPLVSNDINQSTAVTESYGNEYFGGTSSVGSDLYTVLGGSEPPDGSMYGSIIYSDTELTEAPEYDLSTLPETIDGVGYARKNDTSEIVLVYYGKENENLGNLYWGRNIYCPDIIKLPITGTTDPVEFQTFVIPRSFI